MKKCRDCEWWEPAFIDGEVRPGLNLRELGTFDEDEGVCFFVPSMQPRFGDFPQCGQAELPRLQEKVGEFIDRIGDLEKKMEDDLSCRVCELEEKVHDLILSGR